MGAVGIPWEPSIPGYAPSVTAPPDALDPRGDLENLKLTVPLHSVDLGLAALIAVCVGAVAALVVVTLLFATPCFYVVVPPSMLGLVGLVFVPRISEREVLEVELTARTVVFKREPVGLTHRYELEHIERVAFEEGTLVVQLPGAEVRFWLDHTVRHTGPWLVGALQDGVARRRLALDGQAPEALAAMVRDDPRR